MSKGRSFHGRQRETKGCPRSHVSFCYNCAAMTFDDALHDGQTYAGAFKFIHRMETLKYSEKLVHILLSP